MCDDHDVSLPACDCNRPVELRFDLGRRHHVIEEDIAPQRRYAVLHRHAATRWFPAWCGCPGRTIRACGVPASTNSWPPRCGRKQTAGVIVDADRLRHVGERAFELHDVCRCPTLRRSMCRVPSVSSPWLCIGSCRITSAPRRCGEFGERRGIRRERQYRDGDGPWQRDCAAPVPEAVAEIVDDERQGRDVPVVLLRPRSRVTGSANSNDNIGANAEPLQHRLLFFSRFPEATIRELAALGLLQLRVRLRRVARRRRRAWVLSASISTSGWIPFD